MEKIITYIDLGTIEYGKAFEVQEKLFNETIEKKQNKQETENYLIFCEHPHVYTLGKSGDANNLLINDNFLKNINASFYKTNRGGDITYHGFGQLVVYPIFDLDNFSIMAKKYIWQIEDAIIQTLREYNIEAARLNGASGVWLEGDTPKARKICALGVRISRAVTMHGLAFNINTDLSYFNHINPCGFVDKGVTSLQKELNNLVDFEDVKSKLKNNFFELFK
jgi:lipoyl(octanoyl) transferase